MALTPKQALARETKVYAIGYDAQALPPSGEAVTLAGLGPGLRSYLSASKIELARDYWKERTL